VAQPVHVLDATLHQTVAVRVASGTGASAITTVTQRLLVLEQALPLLTAEGAHFLRAVRRGSRHLPIHAKQFLFFFECLWRSYYTTLSFCSGLHPLNVLKKHCISKSLPAPIE
jgi:hypothetical protein